MKLWKWLGLAGLAGVAATGVVVTRAERQRQNATPDEIRARLHARLAEAESLPEPPAAGPEPGGAARLRAVADAAWRSTGVVRARLSPQRPAKPPGR